MYQRNSLRSTGQNSSSSVRRNTSCSASKFYATHYRKFSSRWDSESERGIPQGLFRNSEYPSELCIFSCWVYTCMYTCTKYFYWIPVLNTCIEYLYLSVCMCCMPVLYACTVWLYWKPLLYYTVHYLGSLWDYTTDPASKFYNQERLLFPRQIVIILSLTFHACMCRLNMIGDDLNKGTNKQATHMLQWVPINMGIQWQYLTCRPPSS